MQINIKAIKQLPTPDELKRFQIQHYTEMLTHNRFECRSFARQQLYLLNKK